MTKWQAEIHRTAARTFEEMAFLIAGAEGLDAPHGNPMPTVGVAFTGPVEGELLLRISDDLLPMVAANMLGMDEPPGEVPMWDALGEMANIICGNVLPALMGRDAVFRLQAPRRIAYEPGVARSGLRLAASVGMPLEQGVSEVLLYLDSDYQGDEP